MGDKNGIFEKWFHLSERKTDVKTEVIAGITSFMAMAYILAVNPNILSVAMGAENKGAIFTVTALAAGITCFIMAFAANLPFLLAPGMGLNAYFTYTVVLGMGKPWQYALAAVFVEGLIFIVLTLTNVREAIFNAIPMTLKQAVSVGIGLFIAFIGLQDANLVLGDNSVLVTLCSVDKYNSIKGLSASVEAGETFVNSAGKEVSVQLASFNNVGICALLAIIGVIVTAILVVKKVKGGILYGILITWILGIVCELTGLYKPVELSQGIAFYSMIPNFSGWGIHGFGSIFGACFSSEGLGAVFSGGATGIVNFIVVVFAFLFVDLFDTIGTLIGVATKGNLLDEEGKLPGIKGALFADAVGTTGGAILGTSTVTTFVESASGVAEGGRTGLTAIVGGALFLLSLLLSPIFLAIPSFATAPALIIVGFYMMGAVMKIDFNDPSEGIPAFICILAMPLFYSIAEGIAMGMISYVLINVIAGKAKEKKISILMYILFVLFILKYILL